MDELLLIQEQMERSRMLQSVFNLAVDDLDSMEWNITA